MIPCKECISFAMCKNKKKYKSKRDKIIMDLRCSILMNYCLENYAIIRPHQYSINDLTKLYSVDKIWLYAGNKI